MAQGLAERVQGTSAFLFGWADASLQRGLAQRRKEMGWFQKTPDLQAIRPDVGPRPQKRFGLTGEPELAGLYNAGFVTAQPQAMSHLFSDLLKETATKNI